MAISEDLRSVQATLMQGLNLDNAPLLRLVCSNLQSIAEQVESLENLPLSTRDIVGKGERRRRGTGAALWARPDNDRHQLSLTVIYVLFSIFFGFYIYVIDCH